MSWWQRLLHRDRTEHELDAELRDHLERQVANHIRAGMSAREVRRHARLEFGGLDQVKETCRDARGARWLEETWQDLRFAVRLLVRERWFAAAAVLSLGLGIGLASTAFTVYNAVLVRGLPVDDPDRIMALATRDAAGREQGVSYLDFQDWRAAATSFEDIAAYSEPAMNVGDPRGNPSRHERRTSAVGRSVQRALQRHVPAGPDGVAGRCRRLGARAGQVGWMVLRRGLVQLGVGLAIGIWGALTVGRLFQRWLVDTPPADPVTQASVAALLGGVAVVACLLPARRAARLDPMVALRHE